MTMATESLWSASNSSRLARCRLSCSNVVPYLANCVPWPLVRQRRWLLSRQHYFSGITLDDFAFDCLERWNHRQLRLLSASGVPWNPNTIRSAEVGLAEVLGELFRGESIPFYATGISVASDRFVKGVHNKIAFNWYGLAFFVVEVDASAEATSWCSPSCTRMSGVHVTAIFTGLGYGFGSSFPDQGSLNENRSVSAISFFMGDVQPVNTVAATMHMIVAELIAREVGIMVNPCGELFPSERTRLRM